MWLETAWIHVVVGTYRSWDFGDERGFRSRKHRIHSSGDYKNPPPKREHEGLRKRFKAQRRAARGDSAALAEEALRRVHPEAAKLGLSGHRGRGRGTARAFSGGDA